MELNLIFGIYNSNSDAFMNKHLYAFAFKIFASLITIHFYLRLDSRFCYIQNSIK